jgi:hypothetical protein
MCKRDCRRGNVFAWVAIALVSCPIPGIWAFRELSLGSRPAGREACGAPRPSSLPSRLSETGLFADVAALAPASGVVPYAVKYPLWSDGTEKRRHAAIPRGCRIEVDAAGAFIFPEGTMFSKTFSIRDDRAARRHRRIETRVILKGPGRWDFATYLWNERGDEAVRTDGHDVKTDVCIPGSTERYTVPGRVACIQCHLGQPDVAIGFAAFQLEETVLRGLERAGRLAVPVDAIPNRSVEGATETERAALGYLASNCAHCHNPGGPAFEEAGRLDLRHPVARAALVSRRSSKLRRDDLTDLVVPGDPERSLAYRLFARTLSSASDRRSRMPPIGNHLVHPEGRALLHAWIAAMPAASGRPGGD